MKAAVSRHLSREKKLHCLAQGHFNQPVDDVFLHILAVCRQHFCLQNSFSKTTWPPCSHTLHNVPFEADNQTVLLDNSFVLIVSPLPLQSHTLCHSSAYFSSDVVKNDEAGIIQTLHSSSFEDEARCCSQQINPKYMHIHTHKLLQTELYALIWFCTREQDS